MPRRTAPVPFARRAATFQVPGSPLAYFGRSAGKRRFNGAVDDPAQRYLLSGPTAAPPPAHGRRNRRNLPQKRYKVVTFTLEGSCDAAASTRCRDGRDTPNDDLVGFGRSSSGSNRSGSRLPPKSPRRRRRARAQDGVSARPCAGHARLLRAGKSTGALLLAVESLGQLGIVKRVHASNLLWQVESKIRAGRRGGERRARRRHYSLVRHITSAPAHSGRPPPPLRLVPTLRIQFSELVM